MLIGLMCMQAGVGAFEQKLEARGELQLKTSRKNVDVGMLCHRLHHGALGQNNTTLRAIPAGLSICCA